MIITDHEKIRVITFCMREVARVSYFDGIDERHGVKYMYYRRM